MGAGSIEYMDDIYGGGKEMVAVFAERMGTDLSSSRPELPEIRKRIQ